MQSLPFADVVGSWENDQREGFLDFLACFTLLASNEAHWDVLFGRRKYKMRTADIPVEMQAQ